MTQLAPIKQSIRKLPQMIDLCHHLVKLSDIDNDDGGTTYDRSYRSLFPGKVENSYLYYMDGTEFFNSTRLLDIS